MTQKIDKYLELGQNNGARILVEKELLRQKRSEWYTAMSLEYDILFKTIEVVVEPILDEDGIAILVDGFTYFDYVNDSPATSDWLSETIVITEAIEATYDIENIELTPYIPEVTEDVRPYVVPDVSAEVNAFMLPYEEDIARGEVQSSLDKLVITHNTVAYDANGKAIGNMSAIVGLANFKFNQGLSLGGLATDLYQTIYKDTVIFWRGADNLAHEVMIESVCEALETAMLSISDTLGL